MLVKIAAVAGVAALWLSYHGRNKLIERYGIEKIPFIFNQILRKSCDRVSGWDVDMVGAGLVNAEKVLAAPLSDRFEELIVSPALDLAEHIPLDSGGIETFSHLFEQNLTKVQLKGVEETVRSITLLEKQLAQLLGVSETELSRRLKEVGQELAFHLATNPDVYKAFASARQKTETEKFDLKDREMSNALENVNMQGVREMLLDKETSQEFKKVLLLER